MSDALATVTGPDLVLRRGDAVRLVGPNGCGKTSLLRALAGLDAPAPPASVDVAAGVELLWQHAGDGLVGLTVAGEFRMRRRVGDVPGLTHRDVATLSTGEARRVAVALAEAGDRPLLLLDEVGEGLDAAGRERLRALVRAVRRDGAVVFVDPDGALAGEATRSVELAGGLERTDPPGFEPGPAPAGSLRTDHTTYTTRAASVSVGDRTLHLPALSLGPGVHALRGPNGGGKTTLLRRLAGLLPDGGEPGVPWLPPRARDLLDADSVAACLAAVDADAAVADALVPAALRPRHPWTLSGGEAQRVALATVLGRDAPVYLLDEPDAHLDGTAYAALCSVLRRRASEGRVVVAATHDAGLLVAATTVTPVGGPGPGVAP